MGRGAAGLACRLLAAALLALAGNLPASAQSIPPDVIKDLAPTGKLRPPGGRAMIDLFLAEKLDAAAGVKQPLVAYAKTNSEVRVMDGRFIEQAMGVPNGRAAAVRYLRTFVEEMKASGFVADALKRSNQPDAVVTPANPLSVALLKIC